MCTVQVRVPTCVCVLTDGIYWQEEDEGPDNLTDGDPDTYWESDGNQGDHCITLTMKKSVIIK